MGGGRKYSGMPLGNLTSQFFANVYLNELDHYVKEILRIKYYIRYVDDFVIMSDSEGQLEAYRKDIESFLKARLSLELHSEKTRIIRLENGAGFLGFRIFPEHKLMKKSNIRKFKNKLSRKCEEYHRKEIEYDEVYDLIEGWTAYSKTADSYNLREKLLNPIQDSFNGETSTKEYNRYNNS